MPRSRPATGANASPISALTATAPSSASSGGSPKPSSALSPVGPASTAYAVPPTSRKNPCARESWPAWPVSRVSPIAPTAPIITYSPARSHARVSSSGRTSSTATATATRAQRSSRAHSGRSACGSAGGAAGLAVPVPAAGSETVSDTLSLLRAEQPGRPHHQHHQHHDEDRALGEVEGDVLGGQRLGQADHQAAHHRAGGGVQAAQDGRRERGERDGVGTAAETRAGEVLGGDEQHGHPGQRA